MHETAKVLYFEPFLATEMAQVVEIYLRARQVFVYTAKSEPGLLMTWWGMALALIS